MATNVGSYGPYTWSETIRHRCASGDNWVRIAKEMYDDENLMSLLLATNPQHAAVLIFEGGEILTVPVIDDQAAGALPPWRA